MLTNGSGSVSTNPTAIAYPHNSIVTLTATPAIGWNFSYWSGDISGGLNPTNVLMDADKVITANFTQIPSYTLIVNIAGGGFVTPTGGTYLSNTAVQLAATASNGWAFHAWSGDTTGGNPSASVTMTTNRTVTATFIQPVAITNQPRDITTGPGGTATFEIGVIGTGPLSYTWLFNSSPLQTANNSTLVLTNVQIGNAGAYRVIVSGPYGSATSDVATLIVECVGTNVVSVGTDAALRSAIAMGGNVRLCFSGTITLTNTIDVVKDTILDGGGVSAIISGGGAVRLFNVNTNVAFTLSNVVLANGWRIGSNGVSASTIPGGDGEPAFGGAVYNNGGSVRLVSCILSNNVARGGDGGSGIPSNPTNGAGGFGFGGAIYNAGGGIVVEQSTLIGNAAQAGNGGRYGDGFHAYGRGAPGAGGGVYNAGGNVTVLNCVFSGNFALASAQGYRETNATPVAEGGALFQASGLCQVTNTTFLRNTARGADANGDGGFNNARAAYAHGGAIASAGGEIFVTTSVVRSNLAAGGAAYRFVPMGEAMGGGIYNAAAMQISHCEISANTAQPGRGGSLSGRETGWGGGVANAATLIITGSSIDHNVSSGANGVCFSDGSGGNAAFGGGVANLALGVIRATNCTIALNRAETGIGCFSFFPRPNGGAFGGGIYNAGNFLLVNATIATNLVITNISFSYQGQPGPANGANIANSDASGTLTLRNCLLAYPGTNANAWGTIGDNGYNISSDGSAGFSSGTSFNFTDPLLLPLANNGGFAPTMALATGSPAIDWAPVDGAPPTDQRGVPRPFGSGIDAGAFEAGVEPTLIVRRIGAGIEISFSVMAGVPYRIERSAVLPTWQLYEALGTVTTSGTVTRLITPGDTAQFFRVIAY